MSKRKRSFPGITGERVIVVIVLLIALSSHSGVTHDGSGFLRNCEMNLVSRLGTLENLHITAANIADTSGICTTFLCGIGECLSQFLLELVGHYALIIQPTK